MSKYKNYKKYEDFDVEDLLGDEFFVQWVKSPDENNSHFWEKWLASNPNKRVIVTEAANFVRSIHYRENFEFGNDSYVEIYENILNADPEIQLTSIKRKRWTSFFSIRNVAAVLLLCFCSLVVYSIFSDDFNTANSEIEWVSSENPGGKKTIIGLSDGTKIHLNSNSKITYPKVFGDSIRSIFLEGEAFLEVEKENRPFIVELADSKIEVLGTSFNVKQSLENHLAIALLEGKVKVNDKIGNQVMLAPQEMLVMDDNGKFFKTSFDSLEVIGWRYNYLIFNNDDFKTVESKLKNWFGIEIEMKGTLKKSWKYTGKFHDESLENVLKGIELTSDIRFRIDGKKVEIYN